MSKYPWLLASLLVVVGAFLTAYFAKALDKMSVNTLVLIPSAIILVGVILEIINVLHKNWTYVKFSKWENIFPRPIWGGIRVHNDTWVDLVDCKADLIGYDDDRAIKLNMPPVSEWTVGEHSSIVGNTSLSWYANGKLVTSMNIGRGKDGYLAIAFGVDEEEKELVSPKPNWIYKIMTSGGSEVYHPFDKGYVYIRLSATASGEPLKPKIKSIRFEADENTLYIKEIE